MNETCDVNLKFSSPDFWTRQFQIKLLITFIPIFVLFICLFRCREKIFESKWFLFFNIVMWFLISIALVWTWYKMSKMCSTRSYINILFVIFMILETAYFYLISENDTKNARLIIGLLLMLSFVMFIYIYYIQKTASMVSIIIIAWLCYINYLTYKMHDKNKCPKCGEYPEENHKCRLCKKCNCYYNKKHKCGK